MSECLCLSSLIVKTVAKSESEELRFVSVTNWRTTSCKKFQLLYHFPMFDLV